MDPRYVRRRYFSARQPASFSGLSGFFDNSIYKDKTKVQEALSDLYTYNVHRPLRKTFKRFPYFTAFKDHIWASDTIYYPKYKHQNRQNAYILLVIDTFSKFLWCEPLKNKKADGVRVALAKIITTSKRRPQLLHTDKGTEYYAGPVKSYLKEQGIRIYSTHSPLKSMIAERAVRTVKSRLERLFTFNGKHNWIDHLEDVVHSINNTVHRSIKMRPIDVSAKNEGEVWAALYGRYVLKKEQPPKFNKGDFVKVAKTKLLFEKGYTSNYSKETFIVKEISKLVPVPMYRLADSQENDIEGQFHGSELIKVGTLQNSDQ
jgi:transposase InsO family protein